MFTLGKSTLTARRLTGLAGLRSLEAPWRSLHADADLFARYEWHLACAEKLVPAEAALAYVQVSDATRPVAILPAISSIKPVFPFGRVRVLSLGLHSHLTLADFPRSPDVDIKQIAAALRAAVDAWPEPWDVVCWPRVLAAGGAGQLACAWEGAMAHIVPAAPCNTLTVGRNFSELFAGLSKNLRTNLRRSQKRLQEDGGMRVTRNGVTQPDADRPAIDAETCAGAADPNGRARRVAAAYDAFLELEASGWKGESGTRSAIRLDPATLGFYDALLRQAGAGFAPDVTLLRRGDRPIAAQFAVRVNDCRHVLKIGYDEGESRFSPGQVLMEAVLRAACDEGLARVSLITNMPWHQPWRPQPQPTISVLLFRHRWRAALYRGYRAARTRAARAVIKAWKRVRPPAAASHGATHPPADR